MDEETTGAAAATTEAPPGDTTADTAAAAAETPAPETVEGDYSDPAWVAAEAERINADVLASESEEAATVTAPETVAAAAETTPATTETPKPTETTSPADYARILAELQAQGYEVKAPAPPPDPYAALHESVQADIGTDEVYAATRVKATAAIPPAPDQYAADYDAQTEAREAAIRERNQAAAEVERYDLARRTLQRSVDFAHRMALGNLGRAMSELPTVYELSPEQAKRVTEPTSMTDAVAAVIEKVSATYEAKLAEREKHWQGEVKRAGTDRTAESMRRMGSAPSATGVPGGRAAGPMPIWETDPKTGLPTEAAIQKAIRGDYAALDLSDR